MSNRPDPHSEVKRHVDPKSQGQGVIVVPYRPAGGASAAKLTPPVLIVLLGMAFLAYRSHSADWRGITALFERQRPAAARSKPPSVAPTELAKADPPNPTLSNVDLNKTIVEPLDNIEQEAAKTKARIAELEKAKDLAARKLEETADDREQADRLAGGNQPRFRGGVAPQDLEDRIRAEQEHLAQVIEQMQRRQMDWMNQRQSEFLGRMGPRSGFPSGFGTGRPFMTPFPGFPPMLGFNGMPQPGGGGDGARFRRFQGPGGMRGFEMHWGGQAGAQPRDDPPPPPQPRDGPIFD